MAAVRRYPETVVPVEVDAERLREVCERYGIASEETMAFGDGENDAEMLSFARTGVAVAASDPAARAAADVVCGDIDEDGIARALEGFGLL